MPWMKLLNIARAVPTAPEAAYHTGKHFWQAARGEKDWSDAPGIGDMRPGFWGGILGDSDTDSGSGEMYDYDAAWEQADAILSPQFQRQMDTTMADLDRHNMSRGFYGQMPADVMKRSTAGDMTMQHQGNVAQLAAQMALQQGQLGLQQQQLANQQRGAMWGGIGQFVGQLAPHAFDFWKEKGFPLPWGNSDSSPGTSGGTGHIPW